MTDPAWPWTVPTARLGELLRIGPAGADIDDTTVGFASLLAPLAHATVGRARHRVEPDVPDEVWRSAATALTAALSREMGPLLAVMFAGHRKGTGDDGAQAVADARYRAFAAAVVADRGDAVWSTAPVAARVVAERLVRSEEALVGLIDSLTRCADELGFALVRGIEAIETRSVDVVGVDGERWTYLHRPVAIDGAWRDLLAALQVSELADPRRLVTDPVTGHGWCETTPLAPLVMGRGAGALTALAAAAGVGGLGPGDVGMIGGAAVTADPPALLRVPDGPPSVLDSGLVPRWTVWGTTAVDPTAFTVTPTTELELTGLGTDALTVRRPASMPTPADVRPTAGDWAAYLDGFDRAAAALVALASHATGRDTIAAMTGAPRTAPPSIEALAWVLRRPSLLVDAARASDEIARTMASIRRPDGRDVGDDDLLDAAAAAIVGRAAPPAVGTGHDERTFPVGDAAAWRAERALVVAALDARWPPAVTDPAAPAGRAAAAGLAVSDAPVSTSELGPRCLAAALDLAHRLAPHLGPARPWTSIATEATTGRTVAATMGLSLYDGIPGTGLAFASIARATGDPVCHQVAVDAAAWTQRLLRTPSIVPSGALVGGFIGLGATMIGLAQMGLLLDRPDLVAQAIALAGPLAADLERGRAAGAAPAELLAGRAGVLRAVLATMAASAPFGLTVDLGPCDELARSIASELAVDAVETPFGVAWAGHDSLPLNGLSHGGSGVAWALASAHDRYPELGLDTVVRRWLAHEDGDYDAAARNWRDRRDLFAGRPPLNAWCHGAAGIRLARRAIARTLTIEVAIPDGCVEPWPAPPPHADWLCCGTAGRLLAALEGASVDDPEVPVGVRTMVAELLDRIDAGTVVTAALAGHEDRAPGLMMGLAGVAYALARAAAPAVTPDVLLLSGPA